MKKRILSILLATILVCGIAPTEAFAANETSGSMAVSYTYSSSYTINIPSSVSINDSGIATFSANEVSIGSGKKISITIDGDTTYENGGNFYLYKDKGTASEGKISCDVLLGMPTSASFTMITGLSEVVATFVDGNTSPKSYGALKFKPNVDSSTAYGTYTGTIHFKIQVVSA